MFKKTLIPSISFFLFAPLNSCWLDFDDLLDKQNSYARALQPYKIENFLVRPSTTADYQNVHQILCKEKVHPHFFGPNLNHADAIKHDTYNNKWYLWLWLSNWLPGYIGRSWTIENNTGEYLGQFFAHLLTPQEKKVFALSTKKTYCKISIVLRNDIHNKETTHKLLMPLLTKIIHEQIFNIQTDAIISVINQDNTLGIKAIEKLTTAQEISSCYLANTNPNVAISLPYTASILLRQK